MRRLSEVVNIDERLSERHSKGPTEMTFANTIILYYEYQDLETVTFI